MSYVQNNLLKDEQVCYQTKLHWIVFIRPVFFILVALAFFIGSVGASSKTLLEFCGAFFILMTIIDGLSNLVAYCTSEFAVTNLRVIIKVGLISRSTVELLLSKVEGIGVDQGILGRILNYGTITVTGTGGTKKPYKNIVKPLDFRKEVQGRIAG